MKSIMMGRDTVIRKAVNDLFQSNSYCQQAHSDHFLKGFSEQPTAR